MRKRKKKSCQMNVHESIYPPMRHREPVTLTLDPAIWRETRALCKGIGIPASRFIEGLLYLIVSPDLKDETPEEYVKDALTSFMGVLAKGRKNLAGEMEKAMKEAQLQLFKAE